MSCWHVIRVHFKMSTLFVASHFLSAYGSPEWRSNPSRFRDPENVSGCKDYVEVFPRPNFVSPECPGGGGVRPYKRLTWKCRWMVRIFTTAIMDKSLGTLLRF